MSLFPHSHVSLTISLCVCSRTHLPPLIPAGPEVLHFYKQKLLVIKGTVASTSHHAAEMTILQGVSLICRQVCTPSLRTRNGRTSIGTSTMMPIASVKPDCIPPRKGHSFRSSPDRAAVLPKPVWCCVPLATPPCTLDAQRYGPRPDTFPRPVACHTSA